MSRKNSILIIASVVILIVIGLIIFYFNSGNTNNPTSTNNINTNPFGYNPSNKGQSTSTQPIKNVQATTTPKNLAKLIQIYRYPTSGSVFFSNKNKQDVLRFTDRAVGNTYEYLPATQTGQPQRITNTTIPKIQEAIWSGTGDNTVLRYLDNNTDNIVSFSAKIQAVASSSGTFGTINGVFLAQNLKQLAISPKGDKIFSLVDKSDKSGTYGLTSNLDGSAKKTIFNSPVSYWNISWPKENIISLTTKASYRDSGLLFFFSPQTYSMDRILGNVNGMSTVTNGDANLVAYSYTSNNSFLLNVYDVANKISETFNIATLADKCAWGENNPKILYCAIPKVVPPDNYPDAWYQGVESFSDNIWKINTETGDSQELYQVGLNENADIDAFDLKLSPDDQYLAFSNKNDLSLWLLQIVK